ncbi:DUF6994 family protein [Haloechinothrix halophila]|uniref:DUF6994 family protein n=1 Tax=Haloechinothrix halophila TaxID=1069073 RepID=UPI000411D29E|nr:hypothetical protein [Haloechinothrix halophila]
MTDERDLIEYEDPQILGEIFPSRMTAGSDQRKCSACGTVLPADQLTVIKHRHAGQPKGHLRIYCPEHLATAKEWTEGGSTSQSGKLGPICPNCFTAVPLGTGVCDMCGEQVARALRGHMIDTRYDFQTDTPAGRDPDSYSDTLHRYHRVLWSKELPDGTRFDLEDGRPESYLVHSSHRGQFWLSSDAVVPSFPHKAAAIVAMLDEGEHEAFWNLGYTIGGMMIWPGNRIDNKQTINGARGFHPRIADRFDLTVECIRRHYAHERSPLSDVLARYDDFFALFETFGGFDFFLLQDLLDGKRVRFAIPFNNFAMPSVPQDLATYRRYMELSMEFIHARNARIAAYTQTN